MSNAVTTAQALIIDESVTTEVVSEIKVTEQAPQISTCLIDTDVNVGTAVTLQAVVTGALHQSPILSLTVEMQFYTFCF
mgnify:CR=1 FL=1